MILGSEQSQNSQNTFASPDQYSTWNIFSASENNTLMQTVTTFVSNLQRDSLIIYAIVIFLTRSQRTYGSERLFRSSPPEVL